MYSNRKRIYLVGATAIALIGGFAVATWAVINASQKTPADNALVADLAGKTAYLNSYGQFKFDQTSLNDWILYNMPALVQVQRNGAVTTLDFYSSKAIDNNVPVTANLLASQRLEVLYQMQVDLTNHTYTLSTSPYLPDPAAESNQTLPPTTLVTSSFDVNNGSYNGNYYWGAFAYAFQSASEQNRFEFAGFPNHLVTYQNTSQNNTINRTYQVLSNTNSVLWSQTLSFPTNFAFDQNFSLQFDSDNLNGNDLQMQFTFNTNPSDNISYYTITYTTNNNITINGLANFRRLLEILDDGTNSSLKTGPQIPFIPFLPF